MKPVIVLAVSNDRDDYLPMINRERKNILKSLQDFHDKGCIQVHHEAHTAVEDIFAWFNRFGDRVAIFHYGGHAGGTHLQLETGAGDAQPAHAGGLAGLLGRQEQLQLVFLNGCATLQQVELLLSSGVGAVIATAVPIEDRMATEFAEQFYNALAGFASIQKAFDTAVDFISAKYGRSKEIKRYSYRDVNWPGKEKEEKGKIAWGLYTKEDSPAALEWQLPTEDRDSIIIRGGAVSYGSGVQVNTKLVETLFNEIIKYGVQKPGEIDFRALRRTVIDAFPAPLGEQLRLLFYSDTIAVDRLKQLVITYKTAVEMICFILLSQLWDEKFKNPRLVIHEDYLVDFNSFFALNAANYPAFDYVKMIAAAAGIFEKNKIPYFVAEFSALKENFRPGDEFDKAHLFMEEMKREIFADKVKADEIESFCLQAEEHLGIILKTLAFLVRYKLTTIKTIEVDKPRHGKPGFKHNTVILDRVSEGLDDGFARSEAFTENNSVILLKNEAFKKNNSVILLKNVDNIDEYLCLSPFIIDENAFTGKTLSKLFFYCCRDTDAAGEKPCCFYKFADNREIELAVSDTRYPRVREQLEKFKQDIFE